METRSLICFILYIVCQRQMCSLQSGLAGGDATATYVSWTHSGRGLINLLTEALRETIWFGKSLINQTSPEETSEQTFLLGLLEDRFETIPKTSHWLLQCTIGVISVCLGEAERDYAFPPQLKYFSFCTSFHEEGKKTLKICQSNKFEGYGAENSKALVPWPQHCLDELGEPENLYLIPPDLRLFP